MRIRVDHTLVEIAIILLLPGLAAGQSTGVVTTFAGSTRGSADGIGTNAQFRFPFGVSASPDGTKLFIGDSYTVRQIVISTVAVTTLAGGSSGFVDGTGGSARFAYPRGLRVSPDSTIVYVCDTSNHAIRQIIISSGVVTTVAGSSSGSSGYADGTGTNAQFHKPYDVAVS